MDVLSVVLGVGTFLGGSGTLFLYRENHTESARKKRIEEIDSRLKEALTPLQLDVTSLHAKLDAETTHTATVVEAAISRSLEPLRDQVSTLNTKVEPLWRSLESIAIDAARVLHQPDPARAEIDDLLESFTEGTLTVDEELSLRRFLVQIRNWEPGQDLGFPVHAGEPTAAAILLSTMDLSRVRRKQERS